MRLVPFLLPVLLASGCTSTQTISRSDPAAVLALDHTLRGEKVAVILTNGARERGRLEFVRRDTTTWERNGLRQTVPTSEVARLERDNRVKSTVQGLAIGTGVGLIAAVGIAQAAPSDDVFVEVGHLLLAGLAVPAGALYGTGIGAALGRKRVYELVP